MNAGALQPCAVRQLATPRPCLPPKMKPALIRCGTTTMHLASSRTSSGMPLSGASMICLRTSPAFCNRSTESSLAVAKAMVPSTTKLNISAIRDLFNGSSLNGIRCVAAIVCPAGFPRRSERWSASRKQLDQQYHYRHHQQNVDESAQCVRAHQSQQPQDQQNHENCPKHVSPHW